MTFNPLLNTTVKKVYISNNNKSLIFLLSDKRMLRFDTEEDCCNDVFYLHVSGIANIINTKILETEDKGWTDKIDAGEFCEYQQDGFWTIKTEKGYFDIEVRNIDNGYYGGDIRFKGVVTELGDKYDKELSYTELIEDF